LICELNNNKKPVLFLESEGEAFGSKAIVMQFQAMCFACLDCWVAEAFVLCE
jgi:hypothetical protein